MYTMYLSLIMARKYGMKTTDLSYAYRRPT